MFDILSVNEARFIAMQKQVKNLNIRFNSSAPAQAQAHTVVACLTGDWSIH